MNEHPVKSFQYSMYETIDAEGFTTTDPARAHEAAGDSGWETFVPTCGSCQALQAAQEAEAQEISKQAKRT